MATLTAAGLFRLMPYRTASDFGGWIGRTLGPRSKRHRIAQYNLQKALPEVDADQSEDILTGMWDNFGRMLGEYLHLDAFGRLASDRDDAITFEGLDRLKALVREHPNVIFIGGHFGNWELAPLISRRFNMDYVVIYHAIHEPFIDRLVAGCRMKINQNIVDNKKGRKAMVAALKNGTSICLLVDQKPRDGPLVPFFGRGVKTTTAPAKLALRYRVPIVPVRVQRQGGTRFKITVHPHIDVERYPDNEDGVTQITEAINQTLEDWVRDDPSQWYWMHRRWPDSIK